MSESKTVPAAEGWLDADYEAYKAADRRVTTNMGITPEHKNNYTTVGQYLAYYDWNYKWPWRMVETYAPKIRLKLSEVEALREAVKGNKAVRAILNRFAPFIEIEVDF